MDLNDKAALEHYTALIEERFPPALAALLAAARYAYALQTSDTMTLPVLAGVLETTAAKHPDLKREARRTAALIERKGRG